jgi:hypothetical protein
MALTHALMADEDRRAMRFRREGNTLVADAPHTMDEIPRSAVRAVVPA